MTADSLPVNRHLERRPAFGNAGVEMQEGAADPEPKNALDAGTLHPTHRARVSCPAAAPDMWDSLIEDCPLSGGVDVVRNCVGEPRTIIRDAGSHAPTRMWQPPMLDIAFDELSRCRCSRVNAGFVAASAMRSCN
jgi:hypothetical protein